MPSSTMRNDGQPGDVVALVADVAARGGVKPTMERISVVLPMPLRPRMASTSPGSTRSEMPWSTWLSP